MLSGNNIFLTGPPGAGKTYVLNKFINKAVFKGYRVAVTATTGIAATHIKGTTIHSWSGIGIKDNLSHDDVTKIISSDKFRKRYKNTDILIIDEISMLQGFRLDMVNQLARLIRENNKPFGGIQIILVGDFFQLPPVSRQNSIKDFVFYSDSWKELNLTVCYLTEQHRQNLDDDLLQILNAMRNNSLHSKLIEKIDNRINVTPVKNKVTRLFTHNIDVDHLNHKFLNDLPDDEVIFESIIKGNNSLANQLAKNILAPFELKLKIGAEVMFVTNNLNEGYSNGTRGTVVKFKDQLPVVRLRNGKIVKVERYSWSYTEDGLNLAEVEQIPLRLAWAITVHKSQGMSIDEAEIDLRGAFTPGMGYVAFSRLKSIDGLYLKGYNSMTFKLFKEVLEFDYGLRFYSNAEENKNKSNLEVYEQVNSDNIYINKKVYKSIELLRDRLYSEYEKIYQDFPDTLIALISALLPLSLSNLKLIDYLPKNIFKSYGELIIESVRSTILADL